MSKRGYVLKDLDNDTYFCGAFKGWLTDKKQAIRYDDVDIVNEGVSFYKSVGKNVKKVK